MESAILACLETHPGTGVITAAMYGRTALLVSYQDTGIFVCLTGTNYPGETRLASARITDRAQWREDLFAAWLDAVGPQLLARYQDPGIETRHGHVTRELRAWAEKPVSRKKADKEAREAELSIFGNSVKAITWK